ncbi:8032_t:CDS:2 [Funneliformis geosporum]|uniref:8032_t:CDS:1 n=1 Tax=Funneliformis geosporum TaxID=1117311 RepID=A0A9W4SKA6_9GLOM|nr:8032_t:CDS:2 [Funneliformis geosporum]
MKDRNHKLSRKLVNRNDLVVFEKLESSKMASKENKKVVKETDLGNKEVFECPNCDNVLDRDVNASKNILFKGLKKLGVVHQDGRRPNEVITKTVSIEEDAKRRDFTINALYYDPIGVCRCLTIPENVRLDHECGIAVGNPYERFKEDKLRMIRALNKLGLLSRFLPELSNQNGIQLESAEEVIEVLPQNTPTLIKIMAMLGTFEKDKVLEITQRFAIDPSGTGTTGIFLVIVENGVVVSYEFKDKPTIILYENTTYVYGRQQQGTVGLCKLIGSIYGMKNTFSFVEQIGDIPVSNVKSFRDKIQTGTEDIDGLLFQEGRGYG